MKKTMSYLKKIDGFFSIKTISKISLYTGCFILVIFIIDLFKKGYINPLNDFSYERTKEIAPFVGSFIAVFFSLASTFLVLENLKIQNTTNQRNYLLSQKNQFEGIFFNLLSLQNKIINDICTDVETTHDNKCHENVKGRRVFELLCYSMSHDFINAEDKSKESLVSIYKKYHAIFTTDIGHYFRNLFHIVNFLDSNPYFELIKDDEKAMKNSDYMKILRAQLTNSEIICLGINALSPYGKEFKPLIMKYELLKNLHFDFVLSTEEYWNSIPSPEILIAEYPFLQKVYEYQKNNS